VDLTALVRRWAMEAKRANRQRQDDGGEVSRVRAKASVVAEGQHCGAETMMSGRSGSFRSVIESHRRRSQPEARAVVAIRRNAITSKRAPPLARGQA
jgi:hypothetical protein